MDDQNPYEGPSTELGQPAASSINAKQAEMLANFRQQSIALGALWIIFGAFSAGGAVYVLLQLSYVVNRGIPSNFSATSVFTMLVVGGVVGTALFVLGIFTCMKRMWAIYLGVVLTYVLAIPAALAFNICSLVIFALALIQGHRVISWGKQLTQQGCLPLK